MDCADTPQPQSTRTLLRSEPVPSPLPVVITVGAMNSDHAAERALRLSRGSCIVGAGDDADLRVDDETVSRAHLRLTVVPEGVLVEDLKSHNGTYYLGQRVGSLIVAPGTTLGLGGSRLKIELDRLDGEILEGPEQYGQMLAHSPHMRELFATLRRLEGSLVGVLIQGDSGTGKELVARAIHDHSSVAGGPFVAVNCGALQANLVRSELFGHVKGAFTGALQERLGAFQQADRGTLFLDEIGDLPPEVQPMLLRALEERVVTPLGSNATSRVRVRVIAASHKDLGQLVREELFREDLYYRLMVVRLRVPALRERPQDIPLLAQHFARMSFGSSLAQDTLDALCGHHWPGNVRELRHAVECFLTVGQLPEHSPLEAAPQVPSERLLTFPIHFDTPYHAQKDRLIQEFTRQYVAGLLERSRHNVTRAARISGFERSYLNKLTNKLGLRD